MFTLSDELLLEPELLDVWRQRERRSDATSAAGAAGTARPAGPSARHPWPPDARALRPDAAARHTRRRDDDGAARRTTTGDDDDTGDGRAALARNPTEHVDRLAHLLGVPDGAELPDIPELESVQLPVPRRHELAQALTDALRHVRVDWD